MMSVPGAVATGLLSGKLDCRVGETRSLPLAVLTPQSLLAGIETIADPGFGKDVARAGRFGLDLLSQLTNKNAEILSLLRVVAAPHRAEQLPMREHFAGITNKVDHQIVFFRRHVDVRVLQRDRAAIEIDAKVSRFEYLRTAVVCRGAPQRGANPRQQLIHAERFRNVIIGA